MPTSPFIRHPNFTSQHVPPRHIDIWLPPGYHANGNGRFPTLYMHDGQNLFFPEYAYLGETWGISAAMTRLIAAKTIRSTIVIGIWNSGDTRWSEYMPERPLTTPKGRAILPTLREKMGDRATSDSYLRFLVTELKPFIDKTYRTLPERENTAVMGSSMGGLVSLYALCEYPHIFHAAGCLSTHWPAGDGIVLNYLRKKLPPPGAHKLYFDYGTETLDTAYEPYQQQADAVLQAAGYVQGQDWITRRFDGAAHNEPSWRERVHIPLQFLLT
ncbi:MAG: alpha/beta hydrolase [Anaerolineales bacterium]|nr:alpha/beta hydrolase [Anaerolineales bacterium]MCA9929755.1 alpha/beta hydrolase [Anaerolineales bacterium]